MTDNTSHSGILYIISTPIGNLKDITFRALDTIKKVDYLLCEDTRRTLKLLNHYRVKKKMISYFIGNEYKKQKNIINDLLSGKDIGLVSDGGTPCLSDPGNSLVQACHENDIRVVPIPGPSALTAALSASGIADHTSIFIGFLPRSRKKINKIMKNIKGYEGNIIFYESPYRVSKLLKLILEHFGNVKLFLFKELTKVFESIIIGKVKKILADIDNNKIVCKGEFVIIFNKNVD